MIERSKEWWAKQADGADDGCVTAGGHKRVRLYGYQRAVAEAMNDPDVTVRVLSPSEVRRTNGPSVVDLLCLMLIEPGEKVLFYECTEDET